jgi:hypothetical protein
MAAKRTAAQQRSMFVEKTNRRVRVTLNRIGKLGDLAGAATDADKTSIVEALKGAVADVESRFNGNGGPATFELK